MSAKAQERFGPRALLGLALISVVALALTLGYLIVRGAPVLSWELVTSPPREGMTAGGVAPAIVGTVFVTLVSAAMAIPFGVAAAIYLHDYAADSWGTRMVRLAVRNLAGVPSIVYGLFGLALFVDALNLGAGVLASGLTLGLLTLPWTITASEEALRTVPTSLRDGALALGARRFYAIRTVVLPQAMPGILTGAILAMARAAGETAPILFTGVAFYAPDLPSSGSDPFMALPYQLYVLSTQHHAPELARPIADGTALVLVLLVFASSSVAIVARSRLRRRARR